MFFSLDLELLKLQCAQVDKERDPSILDIICKCLTFGKNGYRKV